MRTVILAGMVCAIWLGTPPAARAHAVLERSIPDSGATLPVPPTHADLWFTEPVDPMLSSVRVINASGARVSGLSTPSVDGRRITVSVGDLPAGVYTVRWRVLSMIDGHSTSGAFVFGIGDAAGATAGIAARRRAADWPPIALLVSRWVGLAAALVAAAAAWFRFVVTGPAVRRLVGTEVADAAIIDDATRRVVSLVRIGAATVLLVATPLEVIARTTHLVDVSVRGALAGGHIWTFVLGTRPGWSLLARWWLALLLALPSTPRGTVLQATGLGWFGVVAGVTAGFGGPAILAGSSHLSIVILVAAVYGMISLLATVILPLIPDARVPQVPAIPMTAALLLTAIGTLNTHAWAAGALAVVADFVHAAAAAVWVGGLACWMALVWLAPPDRRAVVVRALAPRMAAVAAVSVAALLATGAFATGLHVPNARALSSTGYGAALLAKLLVFAGMLAMGIWSWRLARAVRTAGAIGASWGFRSWSCVLAADAGLGALALLAAAAMTLLPPARAVVRTGRDGRATSVAPQIVAAPQLFAAESGDLHVRFEVRPAQPGRNRFVARVTTTDGLAIDGEARVLVRITKLDEDLAVVTAPLERAPDAGYEGESAGLSVSGFWQVDVVVRRRGRDDVVVALPVRIGASPDRAADPAATALLADAERAFDAAASWRQEQQVMDRSGGTVTVRSEFVRPDRLRTRTRSSELTIVGRLQVQRGADGIVKRAVLPHDLVVAFPYLAAGAARGAALGREVACASEPCRIVLWESVGRTAAYAARIGTRTKLTHHVFMVTPSRYTSVRVYDINGRFRIELP